ncbi:MAG: polysaccharide deacetylase family protein [Candidatus Caldarchaeum sp.]
MTVDVEPHYGMGIPRDPYSHLNSHFKAFLEIVRQHGIPTILFICGAVAKKFAGLLFDYVDYVDIGIHTHPSLHQRNGKLNEYSFEEQLDMIKKDRELILSSLGVEPKCFRAGEFCANQQTLLALKRLNIGVDSSIYVPYVFKFKNLKEKSWRPFIQEGILRIPVLTYDDRIFETTFFLKRVFIETFDDIKISCILFHSWYHNITKVVSLLKDNYLVNLDYVIDIFSKKE